MGWLTLISTLSGGVLGVGSEVVEAFRSTGVIAAKYELFLVAPPGVYDAAREAYELLRALRVAIATTDVVVGDDSAEWQALHMPYDTALRHLRAAMRGSLGPTFDQEPR
ncbi:hypothetical protein GLX30_19400 [Streptomyces sp. Tu 2975]|uniref:hypothetical protein n=1 Tax=Streptomyces sp. Tu 2975 TaxID=2676871 RepID=UPI00135B90E5|nr:hypothetical protein [Streptomyces sp. Tu 2975]QIP85834.1 hypothetical protein GLX30_19400 [Streptomyces sp. Tu 2975]